MALEAFEGLVSSSERGNPPDPKAFRARARLSDHRRMAINVQDSFGVGAIQPMLHRDLEQHVHPANISALEQESLEQRAVDGGEVVFLTAVERELVGFACPRHEPGMGQRDPFIHSDSSCFRPETAPLRGARIDQGRGWWADFERDPFRRYRQRILDQGEVALNQKRGWVHVIEKKTDGVRSEHGSEFARDPSTRQRLQWVPKP